MATRRHKMKRSRRNRMKASRRSMRGGFMAPMEWDRSDMSSASAASFRQAQQYLDIHKGQHGGAAPYPTAVTDSVYAAGPSARTGPLDTAMSQIQGMSDQVGGRHHGRKHSRRNKKNMKSRRRKMRGGSTYKMYGGSNYKMMYGGSNCKMMRGGAAPVGAPTMALPEGTKGTGLHGDWAQAMNPNAMVPR